MILAITIIFLALYINRTISLQESTPAKTPSNIHLGWKNDDTAHTMTISWKTTEDTSSVIHYDIVQRRGAADNYEYTISGTTHSNNEIPGEYFHDVELTGLRPDTAYYFICGETNNWSQELRFKTGPANASNTRFVVAGDSYSDIKIRDTLSEHFMAQSPDFVLVGGDIVSRWNDQDLWNNFFNHIQKTWKTPEGFSVPMIPGIGNHDVTGPGLEANYDYSAWYERFELPGNEQWYSLDWGPDIHIIVLDTEQSTSAEQTEWLAADLEAHNDTLWKIVMFHRNIVPGHPYAPDWGALNNWAPLIDKYHVDIVFQGHCHYYMRSKPLRDAITPVETYDEGTMYVITAGWGSTLYQLPQFTWAESATQDYHYTLVDVYVNSSLRLRAIDQDENIIDEAWLYKTP